MSGIFYASSTVYHIEYIDCLYLCVSAMTTTGLATVDLSTLNGFQQACLMVMFICGSMAFVSVITLIVRQHFFRQAFKHVIREREKRQNHLQRLRSAALRRRISRHLRHSNTIANPPEEEDVGPKPDWDDDDSALSLNLHASPSTAATKGKAPATDTLPSAADPPFGNCETSSATDGKPDQSALTSPGGRLEPVWEEQGPNATPPVGQASSDQPRARPEVHARHRQRASLEMHRTTSIQPSHRSKNSGFGGFPTPLDIARNLAGKYLSPPFVDDESPRDDRGSVKGLAAMMQFGGRNSNFRNLTPEQKDELGGIEYRASRILLVIVLSYLIFVPVAVFTIVAPIMTINEPYGEYLDSQRRRVPTPWFVMFNVWSAFTNCGMSLSDQSMIPFRDAHYFVALTTCLIIAGSTGYPVMLRVMVWALWKLSPRESRTRDSLRFLLDHPRRCFLYLFPKVQTWYLAFVIFALTMTDFVAFLVLDIGNETIESIPVGTRILAALMQAAAVRVEGYSIVSISALFPAVQVLFAIMMYIAVLPVALTVRSTNVYEEQSLGHYRDNSALDHIHAPSGTSASAVGKYVGWHLRRQLAFDLWWLGLAVWIICIIERTHLTDPETSSWFSVFSILFEVISAYGTVGLSLGTATDNFSLSGRYKPLSKLVMMAVMLRGRHRALPVALDRAVLIPKDFDAAEEEMLQQELDRQRSRHTPDASPNEGTESAGPSRIS